VASYGCILLVPFLLSQKQITVKKILLIGALLSLSIGFTSCGHSGTGKPENADSVTVAQTTDDSLHRAAMDLPNVYTVIKGEQRVQASIITYTTVSGTDSNGNKVSMQQLNYYCNCGARGHVLPPYLVDTTTH